jgi:predicted house-cleaning noncanonical NTP pyrophosphatase (MazG superfamily)
MKKVHNKLVRDKIPEIIRTNNEIFKIRILDEEEYKVELKKKLIEEANELNGAKDDSQLKKEIVDVCEVIDAIVDVYNFEREKIMEIKKEKKRERGGFGERIFLETTEN